MLRLLQRAIAFEAEIQQESSSQMRYSRMINCSALASKGP